MEKRPKKAKEPADAATPDIKMQERIAELTRRNEHLQREIEGCRETEKALRQSEERFKAIFHNQLTGLLMIDASTHFITDANKTALSL